MERTSAETRSTAGTRTKAVPPLPTMATAKAIPCHGVDALGKPSVTADPHRHLFPSEPLRRSMHFPCYPRRRRRRAPPGSTST